MDLFNYGFNYPYLTMNIHIYNIIIIIFAITILGIIYLKKSKVLKNVEIEGASIGIKSNTIKLKINQKDKEIAYKLWIELSTRKIGIPIDIENDIIIELYDSWYEFFKLSRETLKEFPSSKLDNQKNDIIRINIEVLNGNLRKHLTKWQAKYRHWYDNEIEKKKNKDKTPQEIQKNYPEYNLLIEDLQKTNDELINYKNKLFEIVFKKE